MIRSALTPDRTEGGDPADQGMLAFFIRFHENGAAELRCYAAGFRTGLIMGMRVCRAAFLFSGILILTLLIGGCGRPAVRHAPPSLPPPAKALERKELPRLGYTIQAGAFASAENAARLTRTLQQKGTGCNLFCRSPGALQGPLRQFPHEGTGPCPCGRAPEYGADRRVLCRQSGRVRGRETGGARGGVPPGGACPDRPEFSRRSLSLGGTSAETGFDCSGLTMTVYQLSGFDLPQDLPRSICGRESGGTLLPGERGSPFLRRRGRQGLACRHLCRGTACSSMPPEGEEDPHGSPREGSFQPFLCRRTVVPVTAAQSVSLFSQRQEPAALALSPTGLWVCNGITITFMHLIFRSSLPDPQSQNPRNSAAITAVLLNQIRQIRPKSERLNATAIPLQTQFFLITGLLNAGFLVCWRRTS